MLVVISWIAIAIGLLSSAVIIIDIIRHPQKMAIMNVVWPLNGWFFGPIALIAYYKWGRIQAKNMDIAHTRGKGAKVFVSTSHCASGCSFGDAVAVPIVALTGFTIAGTVLFAHYVMQFALAYIFGILFQFASIYPMNKEQGKMHALIGAAKADTISLIAFEVGMFGWMALVHYVLFQTPPEPTSPVYWFMMQIAMILGFATSYPANAWLIRKGIKEAM
ncbi:DUF4396 domain-containing protein [Sporosarcina trichiuri]|uniref:DUF4396 domain-containing protein n=1 Tax=Sporosarcina trichiuri TaxID=3056445 RepID=UPI0025B39035|nr:DUF4396 domain-containing protein [Sporosarcina sp. 0.2-SM1T-5]WJY27520.1 DUF4396 domain-containing protein [Sporosarcina sp. 0.2-SM1T-5]